jgi:hypothetical protein
VEASNAPPCTIGHWAEVPSSGEGDNEAQEAKQIEYRESEELQDAELKEN